MVQKALHEAGKYRLGRHRGQYVARFDEAGRERRVQIGAAATERLNDVAIPRFINWVSMREAAIGSRQDYTIGEIFEMYVDDRDRAGKVVSKYRFQWRSLARTFAELDPMAVMQPVNVDGKELTLCHQYALEQRRAGKARATIHSELATLRTALNWAAGKGTKISERPYVWLPKQAKPRDTQLTPEEVLALLDGARSHHIRLLLSIALYTGARKSAIQELTWDRVDLVAGTIQFAIDLDDGNHEQILDSSHKKGRAFVAIHPALYTVLSFAKGVAQSNYVIEYRGRPIKNAATGISEAAKRAGLAGRFIGAHALRHTLATMAADAGTEMRIIQKMLGHDDIRTTEKLYAKHTPKYTLPAAEAVAHGLNATARRLQIEDDNILEGK